MIQYIQQLRLVDNIVGDDDDVGRDGEMEGSEENIYVDKYSIDNKKYRD
jgi:hypothetical protein